MAIDTSEPRDEHWEAVRNALANPKYDFRTVDGIVRETGLADTEVQQILQQHQDAVRKAYTTDKMGRLLYTLRDRPQSLQEIISNIKSIVSTASG